MRIFLSIFYLISYFTTKAQNEEPVLICGRDICNCMVFIKNGEIETLFKGDTIPVNLMNEKTIVKVYYPADTVLIDILYENNFVKDILLLTVMDFDNDLLSGFLEVNYKDDGEPISISASISWPLKLKITDKNLINYKCYKP